MTSIVDKIKLKIIGMSKLVPAQIDQDELPIKKQKRIVNAFSPLQVSKVDKGKLSEYKENLRDKQETNLINKESEQEK